ncbi:MAG: hypothetical protein RML46_06685 [Anaerolineae bacterium]|nr:hypothetical protein [Anaerolineae bacterium]
MGVQAEELSFQLVPVQVGGKSLPPLLPWQAEFVRNMSSFNVIEAGRRSGKTTLACWLALREGLLGGQVWWVAPTHEMAHRGWAEVLVPMAQDFGGKVKKKDRMIVFPSGGSVQAHSADRPHNLTGSGLSAIVLDEADHPSLPSTLLSDILIPALVDRAGWLLLISAPYPGGGNGWFTRLLQYALSKQNKAWFGMRVPTSANLLLPASFLRQAREAMELLQPDAARRQFDIVATRTPKPFFQAARFVRPFTQVVGPVEMGLDVGGLHDPTGVVLIDRGTKIVYLAETWAPGMTIAEMLKEIDRLLQVHPVHAICLERNGVGATLLPNLLEAFGHRVSIIDVFVTHDFKLSTMVALHDALEQGELAIANLPELIEQLEQVDIFRHPSGRAVPKVALPHDDLFAALLLAFYAHQHVLDTIGF